MDEKTKKALIIAIILWVILVGVAFFLFRGPSLSSITKKQSYYPQRIVSGMPSITEMLYALGLEDQVVGVTLNCNYPPEARKKEKVGRQVLNLEKVVSLKPDLIIMLKGAQRQDIKKFKEMGLKVFTIDPQTVQETMSSMVKIGELTGTKQRGLDVAVDMQAEINRVSEKIAFIKDKKVLVLVGYNPMIAVGPNTFIDDVIKLAGGKNIMASAKAPFPQIGLEDLVSKNPDAIIITSGVVDKKALLNDPRWQMLKAVKEDNLLFVDADILSRPGPRIVKALAIIADFLHNIGN